MNEVGIISYGLGNVQAFLNAYNHLQISCSIIRSPNEMNKFKKLILPGVGTFDNAVKQLKDKGYWNELNKLVIDKKKPILGVCVGMQIMALKSEEGLEMGLNWFKNFKVSKLKNSAKFRVPHIGWNTVKLKNKNLLFSGLDNNYFYFLHSYKYDQKNEKKCAGSTEYNETFCSALFENNIFGVQFHPEKSHDYGYKFLKNFARIQKC